MRLSFYDHHRQGYGHMPLHEQRAAAEFMVGDYGPEDSHGVDDGGEFAIDLYRLRMNLRDDSYLSPVLRVFTDAAGSLAEFIECGAWDAVVKAGQEKSIRSRDDLTAVLVAAGLDDRSEFPVGHQPVCHCCGRPVDATASAPQGRYA